ncbi:ATP-dependent Clp protease ATP-binding subunit [Anaerotignum lactatifermentans]|uniref:ATP-dependent Clp protease ATP-binding subunit n=1 Tax=Anaerotignum lactatifermentans TaxID=160404 RepID=A0ABS2G9C1_9FIRM|nr:MULTISPECIES: AAA family ATPase [Clostridia]CVH78278.1 Chaperone protein ClpB [Clostridiales bacterium CHKCI006]MBM6829419.1 ATP-dependent Clp protease ATP-binding subunit [Anaerotignum lactatifermentans]MBM6877777.1 ATP-dependent Clp protease ATP-binding subunit [Anaerotignum lactatifermentans]MBM6950996.1 ATP-dependent Clp protease ATP-binding subunit [Anaerotignum lactatifermentans]OUN98517.1 hypothetical protein B5F98_04790 [Pseudoflavonifractor sp. An44]
MDRVSIYEYDRKNRERVVKAIEEADGQILSWSFFAKDQSKFDFPAGTRSVFIDLSSLFYSEDRADALVAPAELMLNAVQKEQSVALYVIIERQYSKQVQDLLYYKIDKVLELESFLKIEKDPIQNIVDVNQSDFDNILDYLNQNLFGNELFKKRLKEELTKYRLFNRIGQQPIFSVLICGASGIGKTEVARLLHQKLAPEEPMIKINFGNYSAQDALNSLIGSPRGYIGSNKGELPDKLMRSRSKVILIDEFEKASKPVYNFFLQLLEEGKFTDSLGREYDLDKYIIVFTSNMPKEKIGEFLPPELRSRFNYKCAFWPLSTKEKEQYVAFKSERYLEKIRCECPEIDSDLKASDIVRIDVSRYSNMRDINGEIMRQITDALYEQIVE